MGILATVSGPRFAYASINYALALLLFVSTYHSVVSFRHYSLWLGVGFSLSSAALALSLLSRRVTDSDKDLISAKSRRYLPVLSIVWLLVILVPQQGVLADNAWLAILIICTHLLLAVSVANRLVFAGLAVLTLHNFVVEASVTALLPLIPAFCIAHLSALLASHLQFLEERVTALTFCDPATGCGNSQSLREALAQAQEFRQRYQMNTTLLVLDIQDYSQLLGQLGSEKTVSLIAEAVTVMNSRLRKTDSLFRYSDSKFVCLLPATSEDSADNVGHDLLRSCRVYEYSGGRHCEISYSVLACDGKRSVDEIENLFNRTQVDA